MRDPYKTPLQRQSTVPLEAVASAVAEPLPAVAKIEFFRCVHL